MSMTASPIPAAAPETGAADRPSEGTARMADGTVLRTLHWPAPPDPWARALLVHGVGEHAGRYDNVAAPMVAAGVDVHGYDHRGFGGSAGPRAWVDRWSRLHDDLEERLAALRALQPARPLVLYGHSMGGLIAAGYVLADPPRPLPDLLVLSAPSFDDDLARWKHLLADLLDRVLPRMRIATGVEDGLSHDPAVREDVLRDPLNLSSSTVHLGHQAFAEQARVRAAIDALDAMPVPTYLFHGGADPVIPVTASEPLGTKGNVTRRVHEGLYHETHHEQEHAQVMAGVVAWLLERRPELGDRVARV